MCDFKPGDEVVCVDPYVQCGKQPINLALGDVYTVTSVIPTSHPQARSGFGVTLAEVIPNTRSGTYGSWRFRKVQKRDTSLSIETFLTIKLGFEEPRRKAPAKKERV